jgi:hypothetical protein
MFSSPTAPVPTPGYARTAACIRYGIFARRREWNQLPVMQLDDLREEPQETTPVPKLTLKSVFEIDSVSEDSWTGWWTAREDIRGSMCMETASEAGFDEVQDVNFQPIYHCMRRVVAVNPFSNVSFSRKRRACWITPK